MNSRAQRIFLPASIVLGALFTVCLVILRPGYLLSTEYLGALMILQVLAAVLWKFQQRFFPFLILIFVAASTPAPLQSVRWLILGTGSLVGCVICLRNRLPPVGTFHWIACFCVLAALLSATAPDYPKQAVLKSLSLLLLFIYGSFGARLAVAGRAAQFGAGLLLGSEALVYLLTVLYFIFHVEILGNPNSLGAVTGVFAMPLLLWGVFVSESIVVRRRRSFALLLALLLLLSSYSRASIAAAAISHILFCVVLRRYKLLMTGCVVAGLAAALVVTIAPPSSEAPGSVSSAFLYKGHETAGLLDSRKSVWGRSLTAIREHPLLGTGFGTIGSTFETGEVSGKFASSSLITREHGNSYLAIVEGVGLLGVVPFLILVFLVAIHASRVLVWTGSTLDPRGLAFPVAVVMIAGLFHAGFEDWLFAVGNYLCVFFWSLAFILVDLLPARESRRAYSLVLSAPPPRSDRLGVLPAAR